MWGPEMILFLSETVNMHGLVHLADLLGEEQILCESHAVFGQVLPKAAQWKVLHD